MRCYLTRALGCLTSGLPFGVGCGPLTTPAAEPAGRDDDVSRPVVVAVLALRRDQFGFGHRVADGHVGAVGLVRAVRCPVTSDRQLVAAPAVTVDGSALRAPHQQPPEALASPRWLPVVVSGQYRRLGQRRFRWLVQFGSQNVASLHSVVPVLLPTQERLVGGTVEGKPLWHAVAHEQ